MPMLNRIISSTLFVFMALNAAEPDGPNFFDIKIDGPSFFMRENEAKFEILVSMDPRISKPSILIFHSKFIHKVSLTIENISSLGLRGPTKKIIFVANYDNHQTGAIGVQAKGVFFHREILEDKFIIINEHTNNSTYNILNDQFVFEKPKSR